MSWCHIYYITSVILYIYSGCVTASEYCVSATNNVVNSPLTDLPCHNLSFYIADYASFFIDNTIFYFLEGTHTLHDTLEISDVNNITLQGLGEIEQGFHETIMQSTSVIMCSDNNRAGIEFTNCVDVAIKSLTVANCGLATNISDQRLYSGQLYSVQINVSFLFVDIINVTIEWVSVQNGSDYGLCLVNALDVFIVYSSFANNGAPETLNGGNVLILYDDELETLTRVNIVKSNFTLGLGYGMALWYLNDSKAYVIIDNSNFLYNAVQYRGGGVYIRLYSGSGSIEFRNCTVYSNTAYYYGGGVYVYLSGNGSIEFRNCTIYNNTGEQYGGGVRINSYGGRIEFDNCTIYKNIVKRSPYGSGGGVSISSYGGNSRTEFRNCTIYNNTAYYDGGGVYVYLNGNGGIKFCNCTIYNNSVQRYGFGGGVYISSYRGNGRIEFCNCTIYNNTANHYGYGGGVHIRSYEGDCRIEFRNCTVYNNSAYYDGGGMYANLNGNGSIEFHDCTIYNNTVQIYGYGGGAYISSHGGNGRIEFCNCTIYNNTAQHYGYGGGVHIRSYEGDCKIEFRNCTVYNNTSQYTGGGMYIYSYRSSIDFHNCTINNNIAHTYGGGLYIGSHESSTDFHNCAINNNIVLYSGRGGGVYIDLYKGGGSIDFSNCTINNNTAQKYGGGVYIHSHGSSIDFHNCTINNNIVLYFGSGGGVYIDSHEGNGSIEFFSCTLCNNSAQLNGEGGGVDIKLAGNISIEFNICTICNNTAQRVGGGVDIDLYEGIGTIEFSNCTIYNNTAHYDGGGVYIDLYEEGGSIEFGNCNIYNNTSYLGSGLFLRALQISSTTSFYFKNVSFQYNKASNKPSVYGKVYRSAVVLFNIINVTFDRIEVSNHNTTGLICFNSWLTFDGHSTFTNNSGIYGGGIALYESSQLLLNLQANISFVNNHASKSGGGIFVSQVLDADICSFFRHHSNALLYFTNNKADISGDVLYGGNIENCFNETDFETLFYYPQQEGNSVVSSDPIQVCFCESDIQNCSIANITMTTIPGIAVSVTLAIVGLKDGLTEGVVKLTSSDGSYTEQTSLNAKCTNVTFKPNVSLKTAQIYAKLENSFTDPSLSKLIEVTTQSCPIGFMLGKDACVCRSELNLSSITCDINTQNITRNGDMWIGYKNGCLIVYPSCPFDYCTDGRIQFKVTSPDPQCLHKRSGMLCGQCKKGLSLTLGSNQCEECTNDNIALIVPFAVAGISLVAFVILLNLTVSVGTINGLIFYANVVKIYEHIFFSSGPIPILSQFISWINLDLGIKTCFFDGMDSCSKTWLQFIFPAYIWFILILIIILLRYSSKMVRLVGRQVIPALATMILLSYTKLIRTVFQILHYTNIHCNDDKLVKWYIDANVQYAGGCHLPLFLLSLAVLILLIVPYTFFLSTIPLFEGPLSKYICYSKKLSTYMKPFFDAYGGSYKDKCRFWTGLLLLVRVVLALVVSQDVKATTSLAVLTSLLIAITFMYFFLKGVYRQFSLVCLELIFILNLILMAHLNLQDFEKSKRQASSIVLVSISFVIFCGIIFYHVWDRLLKSYSQQLILKVKNIFKKSSPTSNDIELPLSTYAIKHPGSPCVECKPTPTSTLVSLDTSVTMDTLVSLDTSVTMDIPVTIDTSVSKLMDMKRESLLFDD